MTPVANYTDFTPESWGFFMGEDIFVAPIVESAFPSNISINQVDFPSGSTWLNWWTNESYAGGQSINFSVPFTDFTVFKRKGSIIPMNVTSKYSSHGSEYSAGALTLLISGTIKDIEQAIDIYEWKSSGISFSYKHSSENLVIKSTKHPIPLIIRLRGEGSSTKITNLIEKEFIKEVESNNCDLELYNLFSKGVDCWCFNPAKDELIIRIKGDQRGVLLSLDFN